MSSNWDKAPDGVDKFVRSVVASCMTKIGRRNGSFFRHWKWAASLLGIQDFLDFPLQLLQGERLLEKRGMRYAVFRDYFGDLA